MTGPAPVVGGPGGLFNAFVVGWPRGLARMALRAGRPALRASDTRTRRAHRMHRSMRTERLCAVVCGHVASRRAIPGCQSRASTSQACQMAGAALAVARDAMQAGKRQAASGKQAGRQASRGTMGAATGCTASMCSVKPSVIDASRMRDAWYTHAPSARVGRDGAALSVPSRPVGAHPPTVTSSGLPGMGSRARGGKVGAGCTAPGA